MVAFIERRNNFNLWQIGHYHYEITEAVQPFSVIKNLFDTNFDEAKEIFEELVEKGVQ